MSLTFLLAVATPGLPEILAATLALCCAALLAEGELGIVAAEADVMLAIHGWV